jgi:SRSO17 transposase
MRRGLTNKISFILILIVSIATLFSYLSDQLAINTEDKLRKNKIEYENHLNKLYTYNAIDTFLIQVDGNIELHSYSFLLKRNFYIKQLLIIEHETKTSNLLKDILKNEKGEYASISSDSFFSKQDWSLKNLKWNLMSEVMDILLLIEDTHQQYDLFYRANKKKLMK